VLETGLPAMVHLLQNSQSNKINREDKKMKTNYNTNHTSKMVSVFFLVMVCSAAAFAQPQPQKSDENSRNAEQAFERLEAFMNVTEQSLRYTAPSDEYADLEKVWERLEMFAENCEKEMRYRVPDSEEEHSNEIASSETDQKNEPNESLSYSANITMAVK